MGVSGRERERRGARRGARLQHRRWLATAAAGAGEVGVGVACDVAPRAAREGDAGVRVQFSSLRGKELRMQQGKIWRSG